MVNTIFENKTLALESFFQALEIQLSVFRKTVSDSEDLKQRIAQGGSGKLLELVSNAVPWADAYAKSQAELLMSLVERMQLGPILKGALSFRPEDTIAARETLANHAPPGAPVEEWGSGQVAAFMGVAMPMDCNLRSMVHFGLDMANLIQQGAEGQNGAIAQAIRIDPSVVTCSLLAPRFARAVLAADQKFFRMLGNALRLPTLRYGDVEYSELRYMLSILEPMGLIKKLGVDGAYCLLAERLNVYPIQDDDPMRDGDQARSLWQFIARWRKDMSTKKRRRM